MVLAFVSIFCAIIGVLVSSIHLIAPVRNGKDSQEAQLAELQKEQPRIQTHIVN